MTQQEAKEWLIAIGKKYIHGGDEGYDKKRKKAIQIAIYALEKQIPKKVKMTDDLYPLSICPYCKVKHIPCRNFKYCSYCGQALDWSDT